MMNKDLTRLLKLSIKAKGYFFFDAFNVFFIESVLEVPTYTLVAHSLSTFKFRGSQQHKFYLRALGIFQRLRTLFNNILKMVLGFLLKIIKETP